jgi:PAS domain-containing protein
MFDAVYFLDTDRIPRDVAYQTIILGELLKHGKQIIVKGRDYVNNPENKFTSWNPAADRLFGYIAEEAIGRSISILAAPDRENEMPSNLEHIRRGEGVDRYETIRRRKDGSLVPF